MASTSQKRRNRGLCLVCAVPVVNGDAHCSECAALENERNKNRSAKRLANGLCRLCSNPLDCELTCCVSCANKLDEKGRIARRELRAEVLAAYGGQKCNHCQEAREPCLTIDHVEGGGNQHRISIGAGSGNDFYRWLKKNNFPSGFQVLCMNCQWMKRATDGNIGKHLGKRKTRVEIEHEIDEAEAKIKQGELWQ